jgi:hypothetical protein
VLAATLRDTQADVPSARRLRAQLAFKDSMIHGILQFTPSIAFRYVLHRCESRDIRCRESFSLSMDSKATPIAHRSRGEGGAPALICFLFLGAVRAGGSVSGGGKNHRRA